MKQKTQIFTSFWFLLCLFTLLLNDFILKETFHNGLTGKLSDFAGLFIFPIFWSVFFPKHTLKIYWTTALFFIFWKSPFSESFINTWNQFSFLPIERVVDFTDLFALSVLPLAYSFQRKFTPTTNFKIKPTLPIILSVFAFMATSYRSETTIYKRYEIDYSKDSIAYFFNENHSIRGNIVFSKNKVDTIHFFLRSDICFDGFDVTLVVEEIEPNKTILFLKDAMYKCPKEDDDREKMIEAFEKLVVKNL